MIEYEVIILDVDSEVATADLNQLAALGWTVKAAYAGDRIIVERELPQSGCFGSKPAMTVNNSAPPVCLKHGTPMVLSFYDRPGGPQGNGWACPICIDERRSGEVTNTYPGA